MTKTFLRSEIIGFAVLLTACSGCASNSDYSLPTAADNYQKVKAEPKGPLIYANKEIKKGAKIEASDCKIRSVNLSIRPNDAATQLSDVEGKWAKVGIAEQTIIKLEDVSNQNPKVENKAGEAKNDQ